MKNIHLRPTDKPSRLYTNNGQLHLDNISQQSNGNTINQNIYITSSENIKEGDYYITPNNTILKALGPMLINVEDYKKIILTTDPSLAPDVYKIDDDFLEWFINNPRCEWVEVKKERRDWKEINYNKIIIPKEEPKQDYSGVHFRHCYQGEYEDDCKYAEDDCPAKPLEEPKQKPTLEEAAERVYPNNGFKDEIYDDVGEVFREKFIEGAKWQQGRSYSEEEVEIIAKDAYAMGRNNILIGVFNKWFKQFKK